MSDHDEDELAISDPHPLFPHTHLSNGRDSSAAAITSSLKTTVHPTNQPNHKRHGRASPVPNRGVGASTSSLLRHEPQSLTPSRQYPPSILISPRRPNAAASLGRVLKRSNRFDGDQSTAVYRADLDELEAWSDASVSSVVFKRPVYKKNPSAEQLRSATRSNLKALTRSIEAQPKGKATSSVQCNGLPSLAIAVPETSRTARCNLIINEIFASDQPIDEGTSSHISSRSSPDTVAGFTQRAPAGLDHNSHSFLAILTQPSRILSSSSGHGLISEPEKRLPLNDLPIPPPAPTPPLEGTPDRRSHSSEQTSQSKEGPVSGLTFAIDPHSALHQKPASYTAEKDTRQSSELNVASSGSLHPISTLREPSPEADYPASIPLPTPSPPTYESAHSSGHSPQTTPHTFSLFEAVLPEYSEAPLKSPSSAPLSTLEREVDGTSTHSVTDNQPPSIPVQVASEELIEIISPMVLEEQYAISSRLHSPAHTLFDPILASSLSSSSGVHFISNHEGMSTRQTSPQAIVATNPDAQNEAIDFDESEFINFDPPEMNSAENRPQPDLTSPTSLFSALSEPRASSPPPAPVLVSEASVSQDRRQTPLFIPSSPSPPPVEPDLPAPTPMARANWVKIDPLPSEETLDTSASYRKGSVPTVLDPKYLQPRYRDLWATDEDNPYLQRAKREMVVGKARVDLEIWYGDDHVDTQNASDEEELDELSENDVESESEDVEMEDPDTGMVFLSQASKVPATSATPTRKGRKKSSVSAPRALTTSSGNPELLPMESVSTRRSNNRPSSRLAPVTYTNKRGRKRKRQESLEGSDKMREGLGDRVVRWESVLKTLIKGKKKFQRQDLLDLKQVLQDVRASAAYISPTSSLVEYVGVIADMEPDDVPMGDAMGLRAMAKKLVQTWA